METVRCDLCGSERNSTLFSQKDLLNRAVEECFTLVRCQECNLCYLNPRPSSKEIVQYYPKEGYSFWTPSSRLKSKARFFLREIIRLAYFSNSRFSLKKIAARSILFPLTLLKKGRKIINGNIIPQVESYLDTTQPGRILDIGCGIGEELHIFGYRESLKNLARRGWQVYGVEISDKARQILILQDKIKCYKDLFEGAFEDNLFDYIRMNWSLEHCHTPTKYLQECKRVLKNNGRLIISIPNYDGITYKIFPQCIEVPVHLYHFTVNTFKKYCEKVGLKILSYYTFSYVPLFATALRMMGYDSISEQILSNVRKSCQLQEFLSLVSSIGYGDDMVFCLTKVVTV